MSTEKPAWNVSDQGKRYGPMATEEVLEAVRRGQFSASAEVCREGENAWTPLANVEEFAWVASATVRPEIVYPPVPAPLRQVPVTPPPVPAAPMPATPAAQIGVQLNVERPHPGPEYTIWQGHPAFGAFLLRFIWSALWVAVWYVLTVNGEPILDWFESVAVDFPPEIRDLIDEADLQPVYVTIPFAVLLVWAVWRLIRRVLTHVNRYYTITNQRIRVRTGVFSREYSQIELFRLKDQRISQPFWGRILNYAHVLLVSSDSLSGGVYLEALPGGVRTVETIRQAAQQAKVQTGHVRINE